MACNWDWCRETTLSELSLAQIRFRVDLNSEVELGTLRAVVGHFSKGLVVNPEPAPEVLAARSTSSWGAFRFDVLGVILTVGGVLETGVWNFFAPDRTYQVFMSLPVVSALALALVLWWLLGGGRKWSIVRRRLVVLLVLGLGYRFTFRFENFEGDMMPRFAWRWTPTAAEKLAEFLGKNPALAAETIQTAQEPSPKNLPDAEASNSAKVDEPQLLITDRDWPAFRGAARDGSVTDPEARFDWSKAPQELWRHPIGAGWSSFSVVDKFAFTQEQRGESEVVVCYEAETGKQVWVHSDSAKFDEPMGGPGPRATPTIHASKVYALGATGILNCLDALTGKSVWRRKILEDAGAKNIDWAMAGSPLVLDDWIVVNPGGPDGRGVVAYHHLTGERVWSGGSDQASYAAPKLATLAGTRQVLIFDGIGLAGHSVENGQQLWKLDWSNNPKVNAIEPAIIDEQSLLIGSGYDRGGALVRIERDGEKWKASTAWTVKQFRLKFNAPVVRDGFGYGLDERVMVCVELKDGAVKWRNGRYGYGQILRVGEEIVVLAESGEVAIVKATSERYEEVLKFPAISGKTWNHPVVCRDLLLVRNGEEAACFRLARR